MADTNLEKLIRDLVARGEVSHISLTPSQKGKKWRASYTMCSTFGISFAEDDDPVQAIMIALTTAKLKKPRAAINLKPTRVEEPVAEPEDIAADLM